VLREREQDGSVQRGREQDGSALRGSVQGGNVQGGSVQGKSVQGRSLQEESCVRCKCAGQCSGSIVFFGPPVYGSVIICADPDSSINKQKN
jgi:hypothetical protein